MGGGVVTTQSEPNPEEADHHPEITGAQGETDEKHHKNHHFGNKHAFTSEYVGQSAQHGGTNQDTEKCYGSDYPFLGCLQGKVPDNEG